MIKIIEKSLPWLCLLNAILSLIGGNWPALSGWVCASIWVYNFNKLKEEQYYGI
jgi:hypothetical protein